MTKHAVRDQIIKLFGDKYDYSVVAEEKHKDGTPHIHAVFHLKEQMKISFKFLDQITGKRGNYQAARDIGKAMLYIIKEDSIIDYFKQ